MAIAFAVAFVSCPANRAYADETQTIPLAMIVVGFDGGEDPDSAVPYDSAYDWASALFRSNESPAMYYREMSNGSFTFAPVRETSAYGIAENANVADRPDDGVIHVTLHESHGAWGPVNADIATTRDFAVTVVEALSAAGEYIDFASYDANSDGSLEETELAVCLCIAGYEGSCVEDYQRTDIPLLWSHAGYLSVIRGNREVDGVAFDAYIAIAERYWDEMGSIEFAEQEPLGVVYHELGHVLGLPDLYAVKHTEGPWDGYSVGAISLMDSGGWQYADDGSGWRNIPTALDGWSRYVLGWTKPVIVTHSGEYTVSAQLSDSGYSQLIVPTGDPMQYYIIENRLAEGQDIGLSGDYSGPLGVVAWHVDTGVFDRYYDANTVNDANHRPGIMPTAVSADVPTELLLYDEDDDTPEAQTFAGITAQTVSASGRDAVVRIEIDDEAAAAGNALHLLDDAAYDRLSQSKPVLLERLSWVIQSAAAR